MQLFRERLLAKAYAPLPNSFVDSASYRCLIVVVVALKKALRLPYVVKNAFLSTLLSFNAFTALSRKLLWKQLHLR